MPADRRIPLPKKANEILDEAKMEIGKQQDHLRAIMAGGLTESEIYRRVGLLTDISHKTVALLSEAQKVGKRHDQELQ